MPYNEDSWKEKVDPAFDKIIKTYLQFLEQSDLPANSGWIILTDESYKIWTEKGMEGWAERYEEYLKERSKMIIKFKIPNNMSEKEKIKTRRKFKKGLYGQIKILPQESQIYYERVFEPFYSESPMYSDYFNKLSASDLKEWITDFHADQFLLQLHVQMIKIEEEIKTTPKEVLLKKYTRLPVIKDIILSLYNSISLLVLGRSLYVLLEDAKNGNNEESFFNLIQIDRTVIECEWAKKMIRKAQLTANEGFFKDMAMAITTSPLANDKEYSQAIVVLLLFWRLGLCKLTNDERLELLEKCGIKLQQGQESFRRYVDRLISVDLKKDIVTFNQSKSPS